MRLSSPSTHIALLALIGTSLAASDDKKDPKPCTVISPRTGASYDLSPMAVVLPAEGKASKADRNESWHARGYDYGANFTINFCAPVVEELGSVVGVGRAEAGNISAFYTKGGATFSIGQLSTEPIFRGRKLVMNYTDGSPCGPDADDEEEDHWGDERNESSKRGESGEREADEREADDKPRATRRKSTLISFLCDQEAYDLSRPKVAVSFVGWSPDECAYTFEARSHLSCGGLSKQPESVGPGGVFGLIALIAVSVYVLGGIAYQRTVMHQRGWRQLPNYAMWAGIAGFVTDMFVIVFSSCSRFIPRRRGYNQLPTQSRGRGISREEENGLIDSLDEEWND